MKYVLFPHGGSGNHGCEAIVRTTVNLIGSNQTVLFSDAAAEDKKYLRDELVEIQYPRKDFSRCSFDYLKTFIKYHLLHQRDAFDALTFAPVIAACDKDTVLLSIGGDNYCYGENEYIYLVNRKVRKKGTKTVLWGCSVEPSAISDKMAADLKKYDLITARESITYETLKALNVNTVLVPDPAFTLEKTAGKLPDGFCEGRMIGINISPLIQSKESKQGMAFANYEYLIRWILAHTDYGVALIPHVVWDYNDDRIPLQKLLEEFADTGRVCLAEDQNCMQLKDVISKCAFFIGARTHATIAAYSTQVPTLVVGYSVKARGIAKDIFGTEENFVLPVQNLENQEDLCRAFQWMLANEHKIREKLAVVMPEYIRNAWELKNLIRWENHR